MKGNLFTNNDFSTDIKTKIDNLDNALTPYLETHTHPRQPKVFIFIILILLLAVLVILQILLINILCATVLYLKPFSINQLMY